MGNECSAIMGSLTKVSGEQSALVRNVQEDHAGPTPPGTATLAPGAT